MEGNDLLTLIAAQQAETLKRLDNIEPVLEELLRNYRKLLELETHCESVTRIVALQRPEEEDDDEEEDDRAEWIIDLFTHCSPRCTLL